MPEGSDSVDEFLKKI